MDKDMNKLLQGLEALGNKASSLMNSMNAETFDSLTEEQKNMIKEARKGLDFSGKESLSSRLNQLTKTLHQNGM